MRTIFALILLVPLCASTLLAQSPPLMNYQGLARDRSGTVLQDHDLSLRISILKDGPTGAAVFTETHAVRTNAYGLFTLQIGNGDIRQGALDAVGWNKSTFWLQVELDEKGGNEYALLGSQQLLSVPYAFQALHADAADKLTSSEGGNASGTGSNGAPWSTVGNMDTDPAMDYVGTSDITPLVFRTNAIERMRLTAYGKVGIGESDPASMLDVAGNQTIGGGYAGSMTAPENGLLVEGKVGIGEPNPTAALEVAGELIVGPGYTGFNLPPLHGALIEGRVGIGTAGPGSKLGVNGELSVGSSFADNAAPTNGAAFEGRVGVGTTIPKSMLGVASNASIGALYARTHAAPPDGLLVQGDVGIGTELPQSKLGVAGNAAVGGTYAGTYPAPEDGLMVEGPLWAGVTESKYKFHILGNSYLDGTADITGNTMIGGTLDVMKVTTVHDPTDVPVIMTMKDVGEANFASSLRTAGAASARKNMNVGVDLGVARDGFVGRNLKVGGTATFKNLVVENYADIGRNPDPTVDPDLNPTPMAPTTLINKGQTVLEKQVWINDLTNSTHLDTAALMVEGGVSVKQDVKLGGQMHINYSGHAAVDKSKKEEYPIFIEGSRQGIAIQLNESSSKANYFVGFWDKDKRRGQISGETYEERRTSLGYILMTIGHSFELLIAAKDLAADIVDVRPITLPFGVTLQSGWRIAFATAKIIGTAAKIAAWQYTYLSAYGVNYGSSSGDYAEWLEKVDPDESFTPGDIVGVRGGRISKVTRGMDNLFVISHSPIVLGNMPADGREHLYEKCAFLGQVPVRVIGPVNIGDYILPSGNENGIGMAVAPEALTLEQSTQVVGVAWSGLMPDEAGYVNVAVGLPVKAGISVQRRQQQEIAALSTRLTAMEAVMRELLPDFDARLAAKGVTPAANINVDPSSADASVTPVSPPTAKPNADLLTEELFSRAVGMARETFSAEGKNPDENPLLGSIQRDPAFRNTVYNLLKEMIRTNGDTKACDRLIMEYTSHP